ncbi:MAG: N utilization substance protein B-like protein [Candidatus Daviesbacteria bacterium GW2011_GWA1_41_61]|uniref:Transcription antitermination protein NusB n=1 Tax=Candidatus Daviesbacteria bacterium GW2011_GWA2_40_9 TaxID=1618424 RepID=A0A0G0WHL9_9BACT|nr:MAG: hypothetical protein UU26_C0003G0020 [Candidatus Daviesbacteria bacterium GW2011_GWC1_40_9]KKR83835.1 MAG: N utilization substance protein B-like protein [Candidatus Daviesbacteria bacterium GW2011_GWA2_40_9]KKR93444.1 MAG: N utilization substance protein B-like protein [Candidatus Daviesbacteria bacterium GW2011_GWB1_41_15]KKS15007.1 MAG: N utilization substance protein B-like protein [Candidatus Daviesbacteria bacterium GW2011_GWA1_41_61]
MKTSQDPRHLKRVKAIKDLFAWEFQPKINPQTELGTAVVKNLDQIDRAIEQAASDRPLKQINRLDLAILRLAIFELLIKKDTPFKVVVDEAVELAKEFGSDSSPSFINGVLGNIISKHEINK